MFVHNPITFPSLQSTTLAKLIYKQINDNLEARTHIWRKEHSIRDAPSTSFSADRISASSRRTAKGFILTLHFQLSTCFSCQVFKDSRESFCNILNVFIYQEYYVHMQWLTAHWPVFCRQIVLCDKNIWRTSQHIYAGHQTQFKTF
jgi:hypothetical protein